MRLLWDLYFFVSVSFSYFVHFSYLNVIHKQNLNIAEKQAYVLQSLYKVSVHIWNVRWACLERAALAVASQALLHRRVDISLCTPVIALKWGWDLSPYFWIKQKLIQMPGQCLLATPVEWVVPESFPDSFSFSPRRVGHSLCLSLRSRLGLGLTSILVPS